MPRAGGNIAEQIKYAYQDHDTDAISEVPPVQNTWYEVFHAEDVRLLWCWLNQTNDENAAKDIEVRWTIDGNVYLGSALVDDAASYYVFRDHNASAGGTAGIIISNTLYNAGTRIDKRGLDFKVEIRITGALGTNQSLQCRCVRETLEET